MKRKPIMERFRARRMTGRIPGRMTFYQRQTDNVEKCCSELVNRCVIYNICWHIIIIAIVMCMNITRHACHLRHL